MENIKVAELYTWIIFAGARVVKNNMYLYILHDQNHYVINFQIK